MKQPPSPPLTYFPAYFGLFASLTLASACNSFLDIRYGTFGFEFLLWAVVFALTLRLGWRQQGEISDAGRQGQKIMMVVGLIISVISVLTWGIPRAGIAILAVLQATQNCVMVTRRQLHLGLLVSVVMVMFAATHFRADWTMLFYLVPYVMAVVFTLVSEQISRRAQDMSRASLGTGSRGGQGMAIVAATATILMGGALLYTITPQVTLPYLFWKYGQPGNLGFLGKTPGAGQMGQRPGDLGDGGTDSPSGGQQGMSPGQGSGEGHELQPHGGWPTPEDMRNTARRPGMPQWQSAAIKNLADLFEFTDVTLTPIKLGLEELWNNFKNWLKTHWLTMIQTLTAMIMLALFIATWLLLKEARLGVWLLSRFDYLRFGLLGQHAQGNAGAIQYYRALQRLLDLQDLARAPTTNTREYLIQVSRRYEHLRREAAEITIFFERARYGTGEVTPGDLKRMRENYRRMFSGMDITEPAS